MIESYKKFQFLRLAGKVIGYPFYVTSPKLGQFVPSIPKGKCIHISASTNVGKSMYWRYYFLISPYLVYKINPDANFKPRWIIFLLEETYDQLYDNLVSSFVFIKFNVIIEPSKLRGLAETIISDEELKLVEQVVPAVEDILSMCKVYDHIYNPTGIFKTARTELLKHGNRFYTTLKESDTVIPEETYENLRSDQKELYKFKEYIQNDPSEYFFVITDNINLLEQESKEGTLLTQHQTIWRWSTEYAHKQLQKNFGCIIVDIVQQASATETQQFTQSGHNIVEKLKPSRDGYGNNKEIARNADLILGLFAPTFYGITEYGKHGDNPGYNLKEIGDFFRTVIVLKNRLGRGFKEIPLFFNGAVNYFAELDSRIMTEDNVLIKKGLYRRAFKKLK